MNIVEDSVHSATNYPSLAISGYLFAFKSLGPFVMITGYACQDSSSAAQEEIFYGDHHA
jgi:hypothetical protein